MEKWHTAKWLRKPMFDGVAITPCNRLVVYKAMVTLRHPILIFTSLSTVSQRTKTFVVGITLHSWRLSSNMI